MCTHGSHSKIWSKPKAIFTNMSRKNVKIRLLDSASQAFFLSPFQRLVNYALSVKDLLMLISKHYHDIWREKQLTNP